MTEDTVAGTESIVWGQLSGGDASLWQTLSVYTVSSFRKDPAHGADTESELRLAASIFRPTPPVRHVIRPCPRAKAKVQTEVGPAVGGAAAEETNSQARWGRRANRLARKKPSTGRRGRKRFTCLRNWERKGNMEELLGGSITRFKGGMKGAALRRKLPRATVNKLLRHVRDLAPPRSALMEAPQDGERLACKAQSLGSRKAL